MTKRAKAAAASARITWAKAIPSVMTATSGLDLFNPLVAIGGQIVQRYIGRSLGGEASRAARIDEKIRCSHAVIMKRGSLADRQHHRVVNELKWWLLGPDSNHCFPLFVSVRVCPL